MFRLRKENKRGLSDLVAYVLLISITISLSIVVYGWLKFYVGGADRVSCPEGVSIIIESYDCSSLWGSLDVTVKNKGLFDIDGYVLRVHDRLDAEFGFYVLDDVGEPLSPGESSVERYNFVADPFSDIEDVTFVDVQPYLYDDGDKILCETYASQKVVCD